MTIQDLLAAGYKEYPGGKMHHDSDRYFAKTFSNKGGKQYQIVFYHYNWSRYPQFDGRNPDSFMPEIYYRLDDDVSVFHRFAGYNSSLTYVEMYADEMWGKLNMPYLERYGATP